MHRDRSRDRGSRRSGDQGRYRDDRSRDERPRDDRSREERPREDRSRDERPRDDRSRDVRQQDERSYERGGQREERSHERQRDERSYERSRVEKPSYDRQRDERSGHREERGRDDERHGERPRDSGRFGSREEYGRDQYDAPPVQQSTGPWDPKAEAEKDPNWARIYVTNLPSDVNVDELQEIFGGLGVIAKEKQKRGYKDQWVSFENVNPWKIKIYTNEDGTQKGDAVITYEDSNAARSAPSSEIRGNTITVELAGKPEPPVGGWLGGAGGRGGGRGGRGFGRGGPPQSRYRPY
ncbi:hypothetical protein THRCLA_02020 [Thraustotheca clavata]|uniref:RRM domain-containing protein n=1 Tax=Thraustotheca clavata TaxID=74557 RepID=A0A1W0A6T4_9STRA|nr:hypothetical protein THRCLA_02020 [Thraustotheca clavata]